MTMGKYSFKSLPPNYKAKMPIYKFRDRSTNELVDITLRITDYDSYISSNPNMERYIDSVPGIIGGVGSIKTDSGFKEVISKVAEAHPSSELAKNTVTRSTAQVKTDTIKKKHGFST